MVRVPSCANHDIRYGFLEEGIERWCHVCAKQHRQPAAAAQGAKGAQGQGQGQGAPAPSGAVASSQKMANTHVWKVRLSCGLCRPTRLALFVCVPPAPALRCPLLKLGHRGDGGTWRRAGGGRLAAYCTYTSPPGQHNHPWG